MTSAKQHRSDSDLHARIGQLINQQAEGATENEAATQRARLVEAVAKDRTPSDPRARRYLAVAASSMFLVIVVFVVWMQWPRHTTDFVVEGAAVARGGFVQASDERDAIVKFSDASVITLAPGARGRVNEVSQRGARFSVESGTARVEVQKRAGGADYVIDAGPHSVKVTGTRFDLKWEPANATLRVVLHEGAVIVIGPQSEAGVGMREGQTLEISPAEGVRLTETSRAPTAIAPSDARPTVGSSEIARPSESNSAATPESPPSAAIEKRLSWAERVASGDFAGVLAEAEGRGIDGVISGAPLGDLVALADAARYGGRGAIAERALRSMRTRFPGTKPASTAAFLLGRMAEDGGRVDAAIGLYDATLAEGSTFAAEALGRKMLLVRRRSGDGAARSIAEQYLKSYSRGPYADVAKSIINR